MFVKGSQVQEGLYLRLRAEGQGNDVVEGVGRTYGYAFAFLGLL